MDFFLKLAETADEAADAAEEVVDNVSDTVTDTVEKATSGGITWSDVWSTVVNWCTNTGIKIVVSIIILIITFWLIKFITKRLEKRIIAKGKADKTLTKTLMYALRIVLKIIVVACLIGYLGIDTAGITAVLASMGVAIGLAINGTLSNFAGGMMILFTRPFKDDDFISACGYEGTVEDIRITYTKIRTIDNKVAYIPNGTLSTSTILNYSEKDLRRVDIKFSISYENDFEKAEKIISDILEAHPLILKEPATTVRMLEHSQSAITIISRAWVKNADYWTVYFDLMETVKKAFDANGIQIPYNQLDVHVKTDK